MHATKIRKIDVAKGIFWIEIAEAAVRVLCGCPADAVKHMIKRGLILEQEIKGLICETGPNVILLSDIPVQGGEFANLAEFPVLQMLYKQGLGIPGHPANSGQRPLILGTDDQVKAQMRYIHRGNYGLISCEEMIEAGVPPEQAAEMMRLKLAFAFGKIRASEEILEGRVVAQNPVQIGSGASLKRVALNIFEFSYGEDRVAVDLNLKPGETYECPYPLGYRRFEPEYFSVIHSGDGDGWDVNRPAMSSIITYQGRIYLIDAGPQLAHVLAALGIGVDQVDGIFQTHAHDDHFAGLTVLMRAGRRIQFFSTPLVKASVAKKLTALLGLAEEQFSEFFDIKELRQDQWTDVDGLEVMAAVSPHPVETTTLAFRTLWGNGYRSYAHLADIVSMKVLEGMVNERSGEPGLTRIAFEQVRASYLTPADVKKIDVGGGMIHGAAVDFRQDTSSRILLAHRADELTPFEKEIGSSAAFGITDILIAGQSDGLRRNAFGFIEEHLPGVPLHQLRMLVNHPIEEINPGAIMLKEGEVPKDVLLLLSGRVEKIRTRSGLFGTLSAGVLIGDGAILENRPSNHTYRASSFLRILRLPASLYSEVTRRNDLGRRQQYASNLTSFLDTTSLFGDGIPVSVLGRIVNRGKEQVFAAGDVIEGQNLRALNIIRSGKINRLIAQRVVEILADNDFFGAEDALIKAQAHFRLEAITETHVLQIPAHLEGERDKWTRPGEISGKFLDVMGTSGTASCN